MFIIPEQDFSKLFEPFYHLEKSGSKQTSGHGFVLFLTKKFFTFLKMKLKNIFTRSYCLKEKELNSNKS